MFICFWRVETISLPHADFCTRSADGQSCYNSEARPRHVEIGSWYTHISLEPARALPPSLPPSLKRDLDISKSESGVCVSHTRSLSLCFCLPASLKRDIDSLTRSCYERRVSLALSRTHAPTHAHKHAHTQTRTHTWLQRESCSGKRVSSWSARRLTRRSCTLRWRG